MEVCYRAEEGSLRWLDKCHNNYPGWVRIRCKAPEVLPKPLFQFRDEIEARRWLYGGEGELVTWLRGKYPEGEVYDPAKDVYGLSLEEVADRLERELGESGPETHRAPEAPTAPSPAGESQVPDLLSGPLSARDLAERLGKRLPGVESYLRRLREKLPDCCIEDTLRRRNETRFYYKPEIVWPILVEHFAGR
jgi:hypothetical protein